MKNFDFVKLFDSMKKNDISEVVIKEGRKVWEFRRGGYKNSGLTGASAQPPVAAVNDAALGPQTNSTIDTASIAQTAAVILEPQQMKKTQTNYYEVKSPLVGTYYSSSKPGKPPFVEAGVRVTKGQKLCIVEAMKNFNEIESEINGIVREVLLKDGDLVEYGKVLFRIEQE